MKWIRKQRKICDQRAVAHFQFFRHAADQVDIQLFKGM